QGTDQQGTGQQQTSQQEGKGQPPPPSTNPSEMTIPSPPPPDAQNAQEVNTHEPTTPFSVRVNLVPVRVVVRDVHGNTVANLKQDDFKIFEGGKPQTISHFSEETVTTVKKPVDEPGASAAANPEKAREPLALPSRFVALVFDDVHLTWGDLARVRNVADKYIDTSFQPSDRFAIFTISGRDQADFTDDRAQLHKSLMALQPRPVTAGDSTGVGECPSI